MGTGGGVFKSVDGGMTWTQTALSGQTIFSLAIDPNDPNTLYAGTGGNFGVRGRIYKSTDGGTTWSELDAGPVIRTVRALAVDPTDSNRVYAASEGTGVFASFDGGQSWQ